MKKFSIVCFLFLIFFGLCTIVKAQKIVNVSTPGTLAQLVLSQEKDFTVTGTINGTDAKYLREQVQAGHITSLNLADVNIVEGGEAYYDEYTTETNVVPQYWFNDCTSLTALVLPSSVTAVGMKAFSGSGLKKIIVPDNISNLGFDAFA